MEIPEASPEALRSLTSPELNERYDEAIFALEAAKEAVLCIQDERFRRYYVAKMIKGVVDWPEGLV